MFELVNNDIVSEEAERSRESGGDDRIEAVSYDSNQFDDEIQTPLPKYAESPPPEAEEGKEGEMVKGEQQEPGASRNGKDTDQPHSERKNSQKSTLQIETGAQTKDEGDAPPAVEEYTAPQKMAVETRSIFSRSFRSRKSTSVKSAHASMVFSTKRHSTGG